MAIIFSDDFDRANSSPIRSANSGSRYSPFGYSGGGNVSGSQNVVIAVPQD